MRNDLPDWLDADPEPAPGRHRRSAFILLAVVPWVLVVLLIVTQVSGTPAGVPAPDADGPAGTLDRPTASLGNAATTPDGLIADGSEPTASESDEPAVIAPGEDGGRPSGPHGLPPEDADPDAAVGGGGWWGAEHRGNWRLSPGEGATAALATVVARAWLTGIPPHLDVAGVAPLDEGTYAEHLVVEAVERPDEGAAVVTLLAVVLDAGDDQRVNVQRLGVPVAETPDGPRPGGSPWLLPAPDLSPAGPSAEPVDDPAQLLAALDALERAGYRDPELRALARSTGWPWIADVRVRLPDGPAWEGSVWLRRHLQGFALAGLPHAPQAPDPPDGLPSTEEPDPETEP
jgi:hypothetical protein